MGPQLKQYIGSQVALARRRVKLTQEQVAEQVERTVEAISNIERAKSLPTLETLTRLAKVLKMPLRSFFPDETYDTGKSAKRTKLEQRLSLIGTDLSDADLELAIRQLEVLLEAPRATGGRRK